MRGFPPHGFFLLTRLSPQNISYSTISTRLVATILFYHNFYLLIDLDYSSPLLSSNKVFTCSFCDLILTCFPHYPSIFLSFLPSTFPNYDIHNFSSEYSKNRNVTQISKKGNFIPPCYPTLPGSNDIIFPKKEISLPISEPLCYILYNSVFPLL